MRYSIAQFCTLHLRDVPAVEAASQMPRKWFGETEIDRALRSHAVAAGITFGRIDKQTVTEYQINLAGVRSFSDFVAAFNEGMIRSVGGHWNGNLDAFNDYLSWPEVEAYRLVLIKWDRCAQVLDQTSAPGDCSMRQAIREIFADNPQLTVSYA